MYFGEIIAFCTTISWSIGIFPFTAAARRLGPNAVNHLRLVIALVFLTILSLIFLPVNFPGLFTSPLPEHWIWFGLSGAIGLSLGDFFAFTSFAILGPRIGSIFTTLAPAAALLAGYFIIGERINTIGVIGIAITISGVIWLTLTRSSKSMMPDHGHGKKEKGIFFGILSAVCQGIGIVLANKGFTYSYNGGTLPFFQATWLRMICATAVVFIISGITGRLRTVLRPIIANKDNGIVYAFGGAMFGPVIGVSLSMYSISLLHDKPSVAQTIFSLMPIFALPLAWLFYREKITRKSLVGALIAIIGVTMLIWREQIMQAFILFFS